jgi:hypothetical protein
MACSLAFVVGNTNLQSFVAQAGESQVENAMQIIVRICLSSYPLPVSHLIIHRYKTLPEARHALTPLTQSPHARMVNPVISTASHLGTTPIAITVQPSVAQRILI